MADDREVVLLLKSKKQDDDYEELLNKHGYQPIFIPVLSFQFTNKDKLTESLKNPDKHCGIILTSQRAVDAVYQCITDGEFEEKWRTSLREKWLKLPVFVTGKATAKRVKEKLQFCDIYGEDSGKAEALAVIIVNKLPPNLSKTLLFPCANIKKETLPSILEEKGYNLDCVTAYCTQVDANFVETLQNYFSNGNMKGPSFIVFFSPSGVVFGHEALKQTITSFHTVKLVAIGPSTSQGLIDHGLLVSGVAKKPNPLSLLEAVEFCLKGEK